MTSFKEIPLHFAEQSKTILTLVVDLLILTIGKCSRYQISGGGAWASGTLRTLRTLSPHTSRWSSDTPFQQTLLQISLGAQKSEICHLLIVR